MIRFPSAPPKRTDNWPLCKMGLQRNGFTPLGITWSHFKVCHTAPTGGSGLSAFPWQVIFQGFRRHCLPGSYLPGHKPSPAPPYLPAASARLCAHTPEPAARLCPGSEAFGWLLLLSWREVWESRRTLPSSGKRGDATRSVPAKLLCS